MYTISGCNICVSEDISVFMKNDTSPSKKLWSFSYYLYWKVFFSRTVVAEGNYFHMKRATGGNPQDKGSGEGLGL